MDTSELINIFEKIADALEFKGENVFKVNAYRKAAKVISELREDIIDLLKNDKLKKIKGIGESIASKIEEYVETGKVKKYEELMKEIPEGILALLEIQSLGPKTLSLANKHLGVNNLEDLKRVINDGSLAKLPQMGEKKVENIKRGIKIFEGGKERIPLGEVYETVNDILSYLKNTNLVDKISPAGSFRRFKETIGDIDILVSGDKGEEIIKIFTEMPIVEEILAKGDTKGSVIISGGIQVDLRVVTKDSYGAALQYFTGSKDHNIRLREIAKGRELKINEYGIFKGNKKIGGDKEEEIYELLNLEWIPPELREDRGEIESAQNFSLPKLIELSDIKGDLHIHSTYSDGILKLKEIVEIGKKMGYQYIAVCDHSTSSKYAGGIDENTLKEKINEIKELNEGMKDFAILCGAEVDIKKDGSLDYSDEILSKLDIVIAAIHSGFKSDVSYRIMKAMDNEHVDIIAHPTGRLITRREGYENLDLEAILEKASQTKTMLELNSYYDRLDLNDINVKKAKEKNIKISLGTDAHRESQFWMMKLGVGIAKRGWLTKNDVLNTLSLTDLKHFLSKDKKNRW